MSNDPEHTGGAPAEESLAEAKTELLPALPAPEPTEAPAIETSVTPTLPSTEPVAAAVAPAEPDGVVLHLVGRTDVGLLREHNEDNYTLVRLDDDARGADVLLHHTLEPRGTLLVVCDGMGGAAAGEIASAMAVATLPEVMHDDATIAPPVGVTDDDVTSVARKLRHATEEANRRIFLEQQANVARAGMGTTMTAALLRGSDAVIAQVGDSRCYVHRAGVLTQVTRDQSLVNQLLETGQITAEQARYFEHSNVILQALGVQEDVEVQLSRVSLRRGDRIMLCSDGLVGVINDEEIAAVLGSIDDPSEAARLLIELANGAGGPDNITVVVAHVGGSALPAPTADDTITYSTWQIDPPGTMPTPEPAAPQPIAAAPVGVATEAAPAPRATARWSSSAAELFSMSLIGGLILGSMMLGNSLYRRGVPCVVHSTRAGMTVLTDGRDSGARTVDGWVAVRLRPGRHSVGLRPPSKDALVPPHQDLEVAEGQACIVSFDELPGEPTATGEAGRAP